MTAPTVPDVKWTPERKVADPLPAVDPVRHAGDVRRRRMGGMAMIALGVIGAALVLQQRLSDTADDVGYLNTNGPFRASIAADGSTLFGTAVRAYHRGESVGWANTLCVPPGSSVTMQVRMVSLADNSVLLYRERELATNSGGCGSSSWIIALPRDAGGGHYVLQRFLLLTPQSGPPRTHLLPPIAVDILP